MSDDRHPVVLVTGASSGVGLALARKLWNSSYRVILTARTNSIETLRRVPFQESPRLWIRELDVTEEDQRRKLITEIEERWGGVDILVNNAGVAYRSVVEHMTDEDEKRQMRVNYFGPMGLARLVTPSMRRKKSGRIINVSSVGGMMAMPTMGSYSASKFALEGASEALWYELRPWGISVTLVEPGFIHSNAFRKVLLTDAGRHSLDAGDDYSVYYRSMTQFIERIMEKAWATPESVADTILDVMQRRNPPLRVSATIDAMFFSLLRRMLPRAVYHQVLYRNLPQIKHWVKKS